MMTQLAGTDACAWDRAAEAPFCIDGVAVDALFEELYRAVRDMAEARSAKLRFEIIAWEPLVAAADRSALHEVLCDLMQRALRATRNGSVTLRVFPSHENACITFQVEFEDSEPLSLSDLRAWNHALTPARARIMLMGGELAMHRGTTDGVCIWFWLPQWVTDEHGSASAAWRQAA